MVGRGLFDEARHTDQTNFHGTLPSRGLDETPASSHSSGRFGRMFRHLPVSSSKDELRLPAGYTYFGQFVDHDITFDPVSSLTRQNDPDGLVDFRTPRFDLDSLYGRGPADQPYLYQPDGRHLALGREIAAPATTAGHDLRRTEDGWAIIGDPRNDENLIVSQLQATMIRFHNAVLDQVGSEHPNLPPDEVFKLAQQSVRWHYQWVVVNDYLLRLVGQEVIKDILRSKPYVTPGGGSVELQEPKLRFYEWRSEPFMPVEFSVAAYRFGRSMARPSYLINEVAKTDPELPGVSRIRLFLQGGEERQSLNGFRPLPDQWTVQWRFLLSGIKDGTEGTAGLPQPSYKLDAQLSNPLGALSESTATPESMGPRHRSPLWFYVLKEAEIQTGSAHLGSVGGRIVAEVLIGLLAGDPLSYLSVQPNWKPTLPSQVDGSFTLSDLINFAIPAPDAPPPAPPYGG